MSKSTKVVTPTDQHPIIADGLRKNTFTYEALPSPRHIRLLELDAGDFDDAISITLRPTSLDEVPSFAALSYTWGSDSRIKSVTVLCGGQLLTCGPNLYYALRHLRDPSKKRRLWVDALCINQNDDAEKSQQVRIMGQIYSAAARTLIWLGHETNDTAGAMQALQKFRNMAPFDMDYLSEGPTPQNYGMLERVFGSRDAPEIGQIGRLIRRPWFQRKWIVQELIRSINPVLVLGKQTLRWKVLESFIFYVVVYKLETHLLGTSVDPQIMLHLRHAALLLHGRTVRRESALSTLLERTIHFCTFSCWDDRDHIISLLGICRDVSPREMAKFADYNRSAADLFLEFAKWSILEHSCLKILSLKSWLPVLSTTLPSWAPDIAELSRSQLYARPLHYDESLRASGPSKVSASINNNHLSLSGRIVDTISEVGKQQMSSTHDQTQYLENQLEWVEALGVRLVLYFNEMESVAGFETGKGFSTKPISEPRVSRIRNLLNMSSSAAQLQEKRIEFLRAVVGDTTNSLSYADLNSFQEVVELFRAERRSKPSSPKLASIREQIREKSPRWDAQLQNFGYRHFCCSEKGRLGWTPRFAEKGDLICVFEGAVTPHVIRPAKDGRYVLVGDCYVRGLMLGEAVGEGSVSVTPIVLE